MASEPGATGPRSGRDRVLVALDVDGLKEATSLLDSLQGVVGGCKIGSQLFTAAGPSAVEAALARGYRVFLDLKFHDIPNTVTGAVREATRLGVFMLNVHASGGLAMMRAAAEAAARAAEGARISRPLCLGVTVLTSLDRRALGVELGVPSTVDAHVLKLAGLAREAGLDGCVASPREIGLLRGALGKGWIIVTPGIRPADRLSDRQDDQVRDRQDDQVRTRQDDQVRDRQDDQLRHRQDDQVRTATPEAALRAGADYLVIGRPITAAADPAAAAARIIEALAHD